MKMNLRIIFEAENHLMPLLVVILLCLGYFNSVLIVKLISIFFQISSLTGQVLVNKFLAICNCILHAIKLAYLFFQVLYEDALVFLKDAAETLKFVICSLQQFYLFLENLIKGLLQITESFSSIFGFFYYTLATFKEGVKLLGLAIWNFITVLPETVIFNINGFNKFILNTVSEFENSVFKLQDKATGSLKKTYLFLFDIPLNSVYGLIIGAILISILYIKFRDICIFVTSAFLTLYQQFISIGVSLWNGKFLEKKPKRNRNKRFEDDERLCIVCQYKLKEMIIFPCKHLCLCSDCSSQLTKIRPICPICRSDITGILKVYL